MAGIDELDSQINSAAGTASPSARATAAEASPPAQSIDDALNAAVAPELQSEKYGSLPQKALTGLESGASVVTGGLSRGIEPLIGEALGSDDLSPEAQDARSSENPLSHIAGGVAGFATGVGAAGLIGSAGTAGAAALGLGEGLGSRALASAVKYGIEGALFQGTNEVGKLITQDPSQTLGTAAINIGLSGLLSGAAGGATNVAANLFASKIAPKLSGALQNAGDAIAGDTSPGAAADATPISQAEVPQSLAEHLSDPKNLYKYTKVLAKHVIPYGWLLDAPETIQKAMTFAAPHLMKAAELMGGDEAANLSLMKFAANADQGANAQGLQAMTSYIRATIKGENALNSGVKNLFEAGKVVLPDSLKPSDKEISKLDDQLKDLQSNNSPLFNVGTDLSHYMPDHGSKMAETSVNAVNYLNSLRPQVIQASPLDTKTDPTSGQDLTFKRALAVAQQPLLALEHIDKGTILPQDIKTVQTLYPGLYSRLSDKLYHGLIDHIHDGGTVPYSQRVALSMFLARPLDSTMTPQSIMAAQPKPVAPPPGPNAGDEPKNHSMKDITKLATAYATPEQAREAQKLKI